MPSFFGFLSSFGKEKLGQVSQGITQRIVAWDPETATQAEIEEMIAELDKIVLEAGKAKAEFEREKAEAEAAQKNYDRYFAAAEMLHKQLESAEGSGDQSKAGGLTVSMNNLLGELETLRPEVEREAREAEEAKSYYDEVKQLAEITADKVKNARNMLDAAKREMKRAEAERQRADSRAERAEHVAGLRKESSSLGVALAAMNQAAEQSKAKASASDMKARLLTPAKKEEDQNIAQALKAVTAGAEVPQLESNYSDRLAALRRK
jgi:hypothetical protein